MQCRPKHKVKKNGVECLGGEEAHHDALLDPLLAPYPKELLFIESIHAVYTRCEVTGVNGRV